MPGDHVVARYGSGIEAFLDERCTSEMWPDRFDTGMVLFRRHKRLVAIRSMLLVLTNEGTLRWVFVSLVMRVR